MTLDNCRKYGGLCGGDEWPPRTMPESFPAAYKGVFSHLLASSEELGVGVDSAQRMSAEQAELVAEALMLDLQYLMESDLTLYCASTDPRYCADARLSHTLISIQAVDCVTYGADAVVNGQSGRYIEFQPTYPLGVLSFPISELKLRSVEWFPGFNHVYVYLGPLVLQVQSD